MPLIAWCDAHGCNERAVYEFNNGGPYSCRRHIAEAVDQAIDNADDPPVGVFNIRVVRLVPAEQKRGVTP